MLYKKTQRSLFIFSFFNMFGLNRVFMFFDGCFVYWDNL